MLLVLLGLATPLMAEEWPYRLIVSGRDGVHALSASISVVHYKGPVHWCDEPKGSRLTHCICSCREGEFACEFGSDDYMSPQVLIHTMGEDYDPKFEITVDFILYHDGKIIKTRTVKITRPNDMGYGLDENEDHD